MNQRHAWQRVITSRPSRHAAQKASLSGSMAGSGANGCSIAALYVARRPCGASAGRCRLLARRGLTVDTDGADPLAAESLALAGLASAAVQGRLALGSRAGARVERLGRDPDPPWIESSCPLQARCDGCDLHAGVTVGGEDRRRLEQLCRYLLRPPIAQDRLALRPDGMVVVTLKTPWRDGTTHLRFEPLTLLERLASLPPRRASTCCCTTGSWHPMPPAGPRRPIGRTPMCRARARRPGPSLCRPPGRPGRSRTRPCWA
jgi:hypothetical protein